MEAQTNEVVFLKAELYDANKMLMNLNGALAEIANIVSVPEGTSIQGLVEKIREDWSTQ